MEENEKSKMEEDVESILFGKGNDSNLSSIIKKINDSISQKQKPTKELPGFQALLKRYPDLELIQSQKKKPWIPRFFMPGVVLAASLFLFLYFVFFQNPSISKKANILSLSGKVYLDDSEIQQKTGSILLQKMSKLRISASSHIFFDIEQLTQIKINPSGTIKLLELDTERQSYIFFLEEGSAEFSVNKLKNTGSYFVLTPTASIEVRGTKFIVSVKNDLTTVHLKEGSVLVKTLNQDNSEEYYLDSSEILAETSQYHFKKMDVGSKIPAVSGQQKVFQKKKVEPLKKKSVYSQKIDVFTLEDGSIIEGRVVSMDEQNIYIHTGKETITIPISKIRKQEILKK